MKIVAISDTHGQHRKINLPEGDVLIHAGDMSNMGKDYELEDFFSWFDAQNHTHKLLVCGNHDWLFQTNPAKVRKMLSLVNFTYLQDAEIIIDGIKFYGSPWQPVFHNWAFNAEESKLEEIWSRIPEDVNVLITHSPAWGVLDRNLEGNNCGSRALYDKLPQLKSLKVHIFGHIHEGYGSGHGYSTVIHYNASSVDRRHNLVNPPIEIEV